VTLEWVQLPKEIAAYVIGKSSKESRSPGPSASARTSSADSPRKRLGNAYAA
jgi:hypothetical protein